MYKLSEAAIDDFHESLERCSISPNFLQDFYRRFTASSPEIAGKFVNTNLKTQARILKTSLYMAMLASDQNHEAREYLGRIANRHDRKGLDIKPEYYDLWIESMISAVREYDPQFNNETEKLWRKFMQPAIEYMKSQY
ncbi:MAG: hemoglobin-like flavoprotein [Gammaproteobacteria bacterium]|jgi:hemoglobin-like flavoprotein